METLDDNSVEAFIEGFFGYGNWAAPTWFIGMEEGGGGTVAEVRRRIDAWSSRGQRDLEDLVEYHEAIGVTKHLGNRAALQPTWSKLVHVLLGIRGEVATPATVREYQTTKLGRLNGASCLIELLPLPSPGISDWIYGPATTIAYLQTREMYRIRVVRARIEAIRHRLEEYRPSAVVFLGLTYAHFWSEIAGIPLLPMPGDTAGTARTAQTLFIAAKHPVARGVSNAYFRSIGKSIAELEPAR